MRLLRKCPPARHDHDYRRLRAVRGPCRPNT